jgi:hypothetical protein
MYEVGCIKAKPPAHLFFNDVPPSYPKTNPHEKQYLADDIDEASFDLTENL